MSDASGKHIPQWISIQYLRAVAALMVVLHHARNREEWLFNPFESISVGEAGVDVFFVISGFIMYVTARNEPASLFLYRRFVRIAPLYWCATGFALLVFYRRQVFDFDLFARIAESLSFIPHYNLIYPHEIWPILIPGWTLNYEIFFYLIFAFALWCRATLNVLLIAIVGVIVAGFLFRSTSAIWTTYTNPIMGEFLMGVLIAHYRSMLTHKAFEALLPLGFALLLLNHQADAWRVFYWGVPAAFIVIGALTLETNRHLIPIPALNILGNASYSLYLVHPIVISIIAKIVQKLPLAGWPQILAMTTLSVFASIVVALTVHDFVEKPISRIIRR